jgi:hypothetical protein
MQQYNSIFNLNIEAMPFTPNTSPRAHTPPTPSTPIKKRYVSDTVGTQLQPKSLLKDFETVQIRFIQYGREDWTVTLPADLDVC